MFAKTKEKHTQHTKLLIIVPGQNMFLWSEVKIDQLLKLKKFLWRNLIFSRRAKLSSISRYATTPAILSEEPKGSCRGGGTFTYILLLLVYKSSVFV
jgi:hypothetical protein